MQDLIGGMLRDKKSGGRRGLEDSDLEIMHAGFDWGYVER